MSEICMSSVLLAEDAVRLPSCVNNLGEYLTTSSDNIREAGGNAIAAHSFSSLEQYIPLFLIQTARIMAEGTKPITMNGIESLDRTGSVLYRDLKGATSFENSFWDEDAAAHSFEQSAVFVNLMEISSKDVRLFVCFVFCFYYKCINFFHFSSCPVAMIAGGPLQKQSHAILR